MRPSKTVRVHLCRDAVDFRKAINGLSILVAEEMELDPFSAHVFGFCNRKRDQVKLLVWERDSVGWSREERPPCASPSESCSCCQGWSSPCSQSG
jgi:hypothetical protein